jgi:hypothetical protein
MSRALRISQVAKNKGNAFGMWGDGNALPELPARLFIDRTSLRVSAAAMAFVLTFYPVLSFAPVSYTH